MAREYVVSAGGITLANQPVTLVFINPSATVGIEVLRCWVSAQAATGVIQRVQLVTQVTAFPTLTSKTPSKVRLSDPVSGITGGTAGAAGTSGINASAEGAGSKTVIIDDAFNTANGYLWVATPKETLILGAGSSSGFGLFLPVAASVLTGWAFGVTYTEVG